MTTRRSMSEPLSVTLESSRARVPATSRAVLTGSKKDSVPARTRDRAGFCVSTRPKVAQQVVSFDGTLAVDATVRIRTGESRVANTESRPEFREARSRHDPESGDPQPAA